MPVELTQPDRTALYPGIFIRKFSYDDHRHEERAHVKSVAKLAKTNQVRLHLLQDGSTIYGFIALKFNIFLDLPTITISYLFTSLQFRGIQLPELNDLKVSEYLLGWSIATAQDMTATIPVRLMALQPAHDCLIPLYEEAGFSLVPGRDGNGWMSMVVPAP